MADEYIKLWCSCLETWEPLSDEEVGQLVRALCTYKRTGEQPVLSGGPMYIFPGEKARIDRDAESYDRRCEANKINGSKGGRPEKPKESENNPKNPLGFSKTQKSQEKAEEKEKEEEKDIILPPVSPQEKKTKKKAKEPKVQCAENVHMTNAEYQKLLDTHGEADTARLIEILDNYKGSTGKRYESDYRAILSWVLDRLAEEKAKGFKKPAGAFAPAAQKPDDPAENIKRMEKYLERLRGGQ